MGQQYYSFPLILLYLIAISLNYGNVPIFIGEIINFLSSSFSCFFKCSLKKKNFKKSLYIKTKQSMRFRKNLSAMQTKKIILLLNLTNAKQKATKFIMIL